MRKFSIFGLAAAAMLTVGCTKDVDTDFVKGNDVVRGELVEMTLVIENSRVDRDAEGKLSWSEGDEVAAVLLNNGAYTLDTEKYAVNVEEGTAKVPSNTAYMIYPASLASEISTEGVATIALPDVYTVATPAEIFDHNPMKVLFRVSSYRSRTS